MKKIILASALSLGLLLPAITKAAESPTTSELSVVQKKKKKSKNRRSAAKKTTSKGCTYNEHALTLGPRGGCYYYSGNSKEYWPGKLQYGSRCRIRVFDRGKIGILYAKHAYDTKY